MPDDLPFFFIKNSEGQYLADYSSNGNIFWTDKERALELLDEQEAFATALSYGLQEGDFKISEER